MNVIDALVWQLLRVVFFINFILISFAAEIIQMMGVELSREQTIGIMGMVYSSAMMYQMPNPNGLPKPVLDKLMPQGRLILMVLIVSFIQNAMLRVIQK